MTVFLDVRGDVVESRVVGTVLPPERLRAYLAACSAARARFERQPPRHVLGRDHLISFRDRLSAAGIETVTTHDDAVDLAALRGVAYEDFQPSAAGVVVVTKKCGALFDPGGESGLCTREYGHPPDGHWFIGTEAPLSGCPARCSFKDSHSHTLLRPRGARVEDDGLETEDEPPSPREHAYVTPDNCTHPEEDDGRCRFCDGGLALCRVCGGAEGSLTTECPGERVPEQRGELVYNGKLDFVGGRWREKDLLCCCGMPESQHGAGDNHQFKHAGASEHDFADVQRVIEARRPSLLREAMAGVDAEQAAKSPDLWPDSISEAGRGAVMGSLATLAAYYTDGSPAIGVPVTGVSGGQVREGGQADPCQPLRDGAVAGPDQEPERRDGPAPAVLGEAPRRTGGRRATAREVRGREEEVAPLALLVCSHCGSEWSNNLTAGALPDVVCMNGHRESADNVADEPFVIRPYQKEGIDWLREHPCGLLGDDMGLGKGLQALRADPRGTPVLVCCPASVKGVWRTEAAKFRPDLKVTIIRGRFVRLCEEHAVGRHSLDPKKGSKRARPIAAPDEDDDELEDGEPGAPRAPTVHKCAECPPRKKKLAVGRFSTFRWPGPDEVVVLNPQIFPKSWPGAPRGLRVVLDEVHAYSYADTTQTRRVRSLVVQALKVGGGAWGLSGTPMWGKPPTLWCVLTTLQLHPWADRDEFDAAFGGTRDNWGKLTWPEKPPTDVRSRLASVMLRRLKADVLTDLPPLTMQDVVVEVDVRARSAADKVLALLDELGLPIEALIAAEAKADFAATALDPEARKKLSPEQWDEARHRLLALYSEARESLVRAKLPAILEFIEDQYEQSDEQLVVFSAHRIVVETLRERPGWAGIIGGMTPSAREAVLDRFASREVRYLTATIQAVGVGINKLVCCSHAILADWTLVPAQNAQVRDRLHRIGQTNPVLVRRFVADHPLDRRVLASLEETAARIEHTIGGTA